MSKEKKRKNGIKESGKRSRNQKKKLKGVLTACIVILVLLVIGLIAYEIVVNTKTMGGNITVNGANVSRLTPEKASETLSSAFESKQLTYVENGNTVYTVTLGNLGYSLDQADLLSQLEQIMEEHQQNWKLFRGRENDVVTLNVQRDDQKFSDALTEGNFSGSGERVASQSASIQYDSQQDTYVVIQDQLGNQIDEGKLRQYTEAYVGQSLDDSFFKNNLQIEVNENLYKAAEVTADSTELNEKAAELNTLLSNYRNASITYTFGSVTEVLNGETTGAWLQISDDGITVDEAQVQFYVENLAGKYNTIYVPRSFQTTGGGVIEVSNNEYGYRIDQSGEVQQILTDLKSGEAVTREPVYEKAGLSRNGTDDLNGSYIEVSLSQQHLWLYKDGALVTETDIISGLPTPERATYTGAYPIAYKASPFTLSSEEYGYETTVQYWMPFVYGQGLHDASWQSSFGGDAYKTRGSHGCVNLPPDEAAIIYNTIEGGYPIILY